MPCWHSVLRNPREPPPIVIDDPQKVPRLKDMAKKGQGKPGAGRPSSAVPGVKKAISKNTHAAKKTKKAPAVHADPQQQAPITKDKRKSFKRAALHKKKNKKQRKEGAQPGVEPAATAALPPPSPAAAGRQRAAVSKKRKQEQPAAAGERATVSRVWRSASGINPNPCLSYVVIMARAFRAGIGTAQSWQEVGGVQGRRSQEGEEGSKEN